MILTYHEISKGEPLYEYAVSWRSLEDHLQLLGRIRMAGSPASGITFDDGYSSQYEAASLLKNHGFQSTIFFITPDWVGRTGYMTWRQARELLAEGFALQSHSLTHRRLTGCSPTELRQELTDSRLLLEDRLGCKIDAVSMPGGGWNDRVLSACAAAGYDRVYISDPWFSERKRNGLTVLGRLMCRRTLTAGQLQKLLRAEGSRFSLRRAPFYLRRGLRTTIGDTAYHQLWCWISKEYTRIPACREVDEFR